MRQASEPSVEEILDSIKRVIARDGRDDDVTPSAAAPTPEPAPSTTASVFRMTPSRPALRDASEQDDAREDLEVLDLAEAGLIAIDEPEVTPLVADQAVSAMRESLAALTTMAAPGAAPQIVRSGETSLEGLTRDLLRPMLADWLDSHLPDMVEQLVAAEIARIVSKKG